MPQVTARWNRLNLNKIKTNHSITSDRQLALKAGISPQTLCHQLTHDKPAIDTLVALSDAYGIAIDHLVMKVPR